MREYETMFVVQPEISDEGSAAILAKLDAELEKGGALRLLCEDWGKRKLAYEIEKFHKGHYRILRYLDDGAAVKPLERVMRLDESILRFLTIQVAEEVVDVEARQMHASEEEQEQDKRAAERAEREAEEARQRVEAEATRAREEEERAAAAAVAAAEAEAAPAAEEAAPAAEEAAPAAEEAAAAEEATEETKEEGA